MVSNLVFDTFAAVTLLATALIGAYIPVVLAKRGQKAGQTRSLAYVLGNMLSAGVMLSAGFVHLLGAAIVDLTGAFPVAPFLCACGFIATLIADKVAAGLAGGHGKQNPAAGVSQRNGVHEQAKAKDTRNGDAERGNGGYNGMAQLELTMSGSKSPATELSQLEVSAATPIADHSSQAARCRLEEHLANGTAHGGAFQISDGANADPLLDTPTRVPHAADGSSEEDRQLLVGHQEPSHWHANPGPGYSLAGDSAPHSHQDAGGCHEAALSALAAIVPSAAVPVSFLTAVLMAFALAFHSVLEGAAMGAQADFKKSMRIFLAILAHKGLAAYALGSSVVDSQARMRQYWAVICFFAFATPLGIFLGYLASSVAEGAGAAAISALASGTFLYVALMEVIPRELRSPDHTVHKLSMLLLGFGLMSLLAIWA